MRVLATAVLVLLAAGALPGCFVLDEIDKGQEIMDQHYGHERLEKEKIEKERERQNAKPGLVDRLRGWVAGLRSDDGPKAPAPEKDTGPPPHPDNVLVKCEIGGSVQFMRKFDCQLRGGTPRVLPQSSSR